MIEWLRDSALDEQRRKRSQRLLVSPVVVEIRFFGIRALDFFLHSWLITNDLKSAKA
jgi:hypothetical protein